MRKLWPIKNKKYNFSQFLVLLIAINVGGCANVPKEVVELSYTIGQDMNAVHMSYKQLIKTHFDGLRKQATDFIDNKWTPNYINNFIKEGELIEIVKDPDPNGVLLGVQIWAEVAIEEIENKKKELIDPINSDEKTLLDSVDRAFARLMNANAAITAHLNSIRKVKEAQDKALETLKVKDLRDEVNEGLIKASNTVNGAIEKVNKADGIIDDIAEKKEELKIKYRRGMQ